MGGDASAVDPALSATVVLGALRDLIERPGLRLSERNKRFLEFVVRETVEGHADRIKAYTVGVDVFGRDQSFDPSVDPIVRIEANRLRSALRKYYEAEGQGDAVRISMSPGTYVPSFTVVGRSISAEMAKPFEEPALSLNLDSIVVRDRSGPVDPETAVRRDLFSNAIMKSLRRTAFKVFWSPPEGDAAAARVIGERISAGLCLDVAVHTLGTKRRYSWRLWASKSGAVLLCDHRDLDARSAPCVDLIDATAEFAACDVARLRSSP